MMKTTFIQDVGIYAGRVKLFSREDWLIYVGWVGMMMGLFFSVSAFLFLGWRGGVQYPAYVWNIPIGILIFSGAIAFDTIGHRTVYREYLSRMEALVHHITIFCGVTSTILLCLAFHYPVALRVPTLVMIALSIMYSIFDEAMHWHRYFTQNSDRVEMWSHFFIFVGHNIMVLAWWHWFTEGYPGVAETVPFLNW